MLKIGTSGFRGIDGSDINENVCRLIAKVTVNIMERNGLQKEVYLGYDKRENSKKYAQEIFKVLHICGVKCHFLEGGVSSSFVSFLCKKYELDLSLMVTASHNPFTYNGVKIFSKFGQDLTEDLEKQYNEEMNVAEPPMISDMIEVKGCEVQTSLEDEYIADICRHLSKMNGNLKVAFDTMHGSTDRLASHLIHKLNIDGMVIDSMHLANKIFTAPIPSKENLYLHKQIIDEYNLDFSFATDGDGDRMAVVTSDGVYHDAGEIAPFLYHFAINEKGEKGAFVGNYSFPSLGRAVCNIVGEKYIESKIGFKYIGKKMKEEGALFGSENSSLAYSPISLFKDGLVAFALLCEAVSFYKKPLEKLLNEFKQEMDYHLNYLERSYHFVDSNSTQSDKDVLEGLDMRGLFKTIHGEKLTSIGTLDGYKYHYPSSTVLIRQSGTEKVIRIVIESKFSAEEVLKEVIENLSSYAENALNF